jgi:hypothetical protein
LVNSPCKPSIDYTVLFINPLPGFSALPVSAFPID